MMEFLSTAAVSEAHSVAVRMHERIDGVVIGGGGRQVRALPESRNGLIPIAGAKPVAERVPEGQAKLLAGFHQVEQRVAGNATISAYRTA